ncbi:hypothetical protein UFOVP1083_53, partial [uncultured Caudovirales phage]
VPSPHDRDAAPPHPLGVPVRFMFTRARTFGIFWTDV